MPTPMPALDVTACANWTEQQVNLYNSLPYYLMMMQVERRKTWLIWDRFMGNAKWTPNMGPIMRSVRKEPSPHMRQQAIPNDIGTAARKDVMDVREVSVDATIKHQKFESPVLTYLPDFKDFMKNHVEANGKDIMEKEERFEDLFYRTAVFHLSPNLWIPDAAGGSMVSAPQGEPDFNTPNAGKNQNYLQAMFPTIGQAGNLSLLTLNQLITSAETDIRIPPWKGSEIPKDEKGMENKFAIVMSTEAFNQYTFDPFLLANKNCNLDIINGKFQGNFFGRATAILEDMPYRFAADGSMPYPEVRELNPQAYNYGESIPNPAYTNPDLAPYEVAFLIGMEGYDNIDVGPPPKAFASNGMDEGFGKMFWNGEIKATKNLNVPCVYDDGTVLWEPNAYGEYLKFISHCVYGIRARQRRNIIPILFKRKRGV